MSQPPAYNRQFDFADFQSTAPADPLPGNQVDAEFNAVKTTIGATLSNLAVIQRDDGKLRNQSVHPESIANATLTLLNSDIVIRGAWVTATAYAQNDVVTNSSNAYLCLIAHTSGTFATDLSNAKWALLTQQGLAPDGSTVPSANLPMGGFKFTGLGNGAARTDSVNLGQVQDMPLQWAAVSGTGNAIVLTLTPAITVYVAGQTWKFKATANNSGVTTVNAGGGVIAIQYNGAALIGGEIKTGRTYELTYDGTAAQLSAFLEAPVPIGNGGTGAMTAATAFGNLKQAASDSATGVVELALASEVNAATAGKVPTTDQLPSAPYTGRRNRLINGDFQVWQRGTTFAPTTGVQTNVADRWQAFINGTVGSLSISRSELTQGRRQQIKALTGSAPSYGFQWVQNTAGSGQTVKYFEEKIENLRQFQSCAVRVSFIGFCSSGSVDCGAVLLYDYGTGGSPTATAASSSSPFTLTSTVQRFAFTITVPDFSSDTFGSDGPHTSFMRARINLPLNATHNVTFTDFQVEVGEATTPYDRRQFADELRDCQRYYFKTFPYATTPAQNAGITGAKTWLNVRGNSAACETNAETFPVPMRVAPTITTYNPSAANAQVRNVTDSTDCTAVGSTVTAERFSITYTGTTGTDSTDKMGVHLSADAEL